MDKIKISLLGTASWVPDIRIKSEDLMKVLNVGQPPNWAEKKIGIKERALAISLPELKPLKEIAPSCAEISEKICKQLLEETNTDPKEIQHLILVTCTPDELNFKFTTTELHRRLGLKRTARIHEIPSGCSGLIEAWDTATAYLKGILSMESKVLVVAINLTSPFFIDWQKYVCQKEWLAALIFADGACAQLFQSQPSEIETGKPQLLYTFFEIDGSHPLMRYPAGGVLAPTTPQNTHRHIYSMDAKEVKQYYRIAMVRNFERLHETMPNFVLQQCKKIYLHQANPKAVEIFRILAGLNENQVPLAGDYLGNPAAAIAGIMLDQDVKKNIFQKGDLVLCSVVGAGAINGAAILQF